jgi:hypothetical protein
VRLAGVAKGLTRADLKSVAGSVGAGSALAGGFGLMAGGPALGAASAAADFALAYPLTLAARAARPGKTRTVINEAGKQVTEHVPSRLEGAANLAGSIVSPLVADVATGGAMSRPVEPTVMSQDQTIMHQMMQRAAVNDMQLPQEVAPYTQFQTAGLPNRNQFLNDYIYPPVAGSEVELPDAVKRALQRTGLELGL